MQIFLSGKISRGGEDIEAWATLADFRRVHRSLCFHRKELCLTELLANLVVSKKIKEHLFVHSKVLGISIFSQQSAV